MTNQTEPKPRHQVIAERAYELYEARGGQDGLAEEDWAAAEAEIGPDPQETAPVEQPSVTDAGEAATGPH
jgi:hypothetical protein